MGGGLLLGPIKGFFPTPHFFSSFGHHPLWFHENRENRENYRENQENLKIGWGDAHGCFFFLPQMRRTTENIPTK